VKSTLWDARINHVANTYRLVPTVTSRAVTKFGNWSVSLDDGIDDHHVEIDGATRLEVGEILRETLYGHRWKITHVNADGLFARAVPVEDSGREV